MNKKEMERSGPRRNPNDLMAWLKDFVYQLVVSWQLLWDQRIPLSTKLVPLLVLIYLISPLDIVPDALLGFGQLDDLALFLVGLRLFISLSPREIVEEYQRNLPEEEASQGSEASPVIDLESRPPAGRGEQAQIEDKSRSEGQTETGGGEEESEEGGSAL